MSFECAVFADGFRCQSEQRGDTTYLGSLTFCLEHQLAFEDLVSVKVLAQEVASAKLQRFFGPALVESLTTPAQIMSTPTPPAEVYFMRCDSFVKIGASRAPVRRLKQIRSADGTKFPEGLNCLSTALIATERGGFEREKELHKQFRHLRHTGEWFTETPELTDYINALDAAA